jgi:homocysteine S-methyltransferase
MEPSVLDGGLATELERRGCVLSDAMWSGTALLADAELVARVHHDFAAAGSDVVTTATYQLSWEGLKHDGGVEKGVESMAEFFGRAIDACRCGALVGVSLGPFCACLGDGSEYAPWWRWSPRAPDIGAFLRKDRARRASLQVLGPRADAGEGDCHVVEWLSAFHADRLQALRDSEARFDTLAFETIPCLAEGVAIGRVLRNCWERDPTWPPAAWVSFCVRDEDGSLLRSAEALVDAVRALEEACGHRPQLVAVGVNCCAPSAAVTAAASIASLPAPPPSDAPTPRSLRDRIRTPTDAARKRGIILYPNSGEKWDAATGTWSGGEAELDWVAAATERVRGSEGSELVALGGCCRTTPDHIHAIAHAVRK